MVCLFWKLFPTFSSSIIIIMQAFFLRGFGGVGWIEFPSFTKWRMHLHVQFLNWKCQNKSSNTSGMWSNFLPIFLDTFSTFYPPCFCISIKLGHKTYLNFPNDHPPSPWPCEFRCFNLDFSDLQLFLSYGRPHSQFNPPQLSAVLVLFAILVNTVVKYTERI